jgi:diaminopimelate epimerase
VGTFPVKYQKRKITLSMPLTEIPREFQLSELPLDALPKMPQHVYYTKVGVPHLFLIFDSMENFFDFKIDAPSLPLRHHSIFPSGTNVNYVVLKSPNEYCLRTFERGVEGETLSCGTGVLSLGAVLYHFKNQKTPVVIHTKGGIVQVHGSEGQIQYSGEVRKVFEGNYFF